MDSSQLRIICTQPKYKVEIIILSLLRWENVFSHTRFSWMLFLNMDIVGKSSVPVFYNNNWCQKSEESSSFICFSCFTFTKSALGDKAFVTSQMAARPVTSTLSQVFQVPCDTSLPQLPCVCSLCGRPSEASDWAGSSQKPFSQERL